MRQESKTNLDPLNYKLHDAAFFCEYAVIKEVLEQGANPNSLDSDGWSPLTTVIWKGSDTCAKLLIEHGADLYPKVDLLRLAAVNQHGACLSLLLDQGMDINFKDKDGWTVLHHLASLNLTHERLFSLLIDCGADVNAQNRFGSTPLLIAADYNNINAARILIANSADITIMNNYKKTPMDIALENEHKQIVEYINAAILKTKILDQLAVNNNDVLSINCDRPFSL